uniref:Ubinuclein 2b n=1 Tax=Oryzias sinensis TaxID=183150 RepID=A0A8C7YEM4_9TELE
MAEPRKVQFVTLSSFNTSPPTQESNKKRRREDEAIVTHGKDGGGGAAAVGSGGGGGGLFGNAKGSDAAAEEGKPTVRLCLPLSEPNERGSSEFNYGELVQPPAQRPRPPPLCLAPPLDPSDPFADDEKERREVEELARKFENKYGGAAKKKKKDRMQDLIDIGYAFVPCNKEALLKRLKKLSLNIQDDRLRNPLLKLKLAVCSVMPEQIARYNMDCIAKVAKQQSEEGEKNGSEDDDEEKPGKRVMGPRKKFVWDDKLRMLLCNLVRVKMGCYELEGKTSVSLEDYLKAFMETEVKPLWPKGWMQDSGYKCLFFQEAAWVQRSTPTAAATPSPAAVVAKRLPQSPSEPICLDSLDEAPSVDAISQALAILGNAAKGLAQGDSPPSPERPKAATNPPNLLVSPLLQQHKKTSVSTPISSAPHYISTSSPSSSSLSRPPTGTSSPLTSVRVEAMGVLKGAASQVHRHPVLNTQRPLSVAVTKASMPISAAMPKPRPPPTASPLVAPGSKAGVSTPPSSLLKGSNNKAISDAVIITSSQSRPLTIQSPAANVPKTFQTSRLVMTPQSKSSPSLTQTLPGAQPQPQSNFITPMHATLTKSTHSSIPPIVKLTPRTQNAIITTAATSAATSVSLTPRSQAAPSIHQYPPKTLAGYRLPFSGSTGGAAKQGPGSYPSPSSQKSPSINSSTTPEDRGWDASGVKAGRVRPSCPSVVRLVSVTTGLCRPFQTQTCDGRGCKKASSVQVSSTGGGGLLSSASSLPLGFAGMLGGLVPVSLPFQFPAMLNLPQMGTGGSSTAASSSAAGSSKTMS